MCGGSGGSICDITVCGAERNDVAILQHHRAPALNVGGCIGEGSPLVGGRGVLPDLADVYECNIIYGCECDSVIGKRCNLFRTDCK